MKRFGLRHLGIGVVAAAATLGWAGSSPAAVITASFRDGVDGYAGTDDNQILNFSTNVGVNNGASPSMQAGTTAGPSERRILIRFDVSSLVGQYGSIESARLELVGTGSAVGAGGSEVSVSLHAIADANAGWEEGTGSARAAVAGESTWRFLREDTVAANRRTWAGAQGLYTAGTDYNATALDTVVYKDADEAGQVYSFDITPSLIMHWITDTNPGLLLISDTPSTIAVAQFYSSNMATVNLRPQLVIEYTPVPEPAAGGLLALGAIALVHRKRRQA